VALIAIIDEMAIGYLDKTLNELLKHVENVFEDYHSIQILRLEKLAANSETLPTIFESLIDLLHYLLGCIDQLKAVNKSQVSCLAKSTNEGGYDCRLKWDEILTQDTRLRPKKKEAFPSYCNLSDDIGKEVCRHFERNKLVWEISLVNKRVRRQVSKTVKELSIPVVLDVNHPLFGERLMMFQKSPLLCSSIHYLSIKKHGPEYLTKKENKGCGKLLEKLINLRILNIDGIKYSITENLTSFCKLIAKSPKSLEVIERTYSRRVRLGDGHKNKLVSKSIFKSAPMVERECVYENVDNSKKRQLRYSYKRNEIMKENYWKSLLI